VFLLSQIVNKIFKILYTNFLFIYNTPTFLNLTNIKTHFDNYKTTNNLNSMLYSKLPKIEQKIAKLGFGTWQFANSSGSWIGSIKEESQDTLQTALESGVNFIDTAMVYADGLAESWIGEVVNKFGREKVIIASKIYAKGGWKEPNKNSDVEEFYPESWIYEAVETSLKNLNTNYIDMMQFHVWNDVFASSEGWKKAIKKLTESGKVRSWGISLVGHDCEDFKATIVCR
jgi:aryl-alcohol dehydrogenase-like predicted oxidoreductase